MPTRIKIASRKVNRKKTAIKAGKKTAKKTTANNKPKKPAVIPPEATVPAPEITVFEVVETEIYREPDLVIVETHEEFGT